MLVSILAIVFVLILFLVARNARELGEKRHYATHAQMAEFLALLNQVTQVFSVAKLVLTFITHSFKTKILPQAYLLCMTIC